MNIFIKSTKLGKNLFIAYNAMVAVVLPDTNGSYSYYLEKKSCCNSGCTTHHTNKLFKIIKKNKFNIKSPDKWVCDSGDNIWRGDHSYIKAVKWADFIKNYTSYITSACNRQDNIDNYDITKNIS